MTTSTAAFDTASTSWFSSLNYNPADYKRDMRIDFIRGFVIPLLFVSHFEFFSLYMYIGWERLGAVSTAEIFVLISGVVVGMVYGKPVKNGDFKITLGKLLSRAGELYKISLIMILTVAAFHHLQLIEKTSLFGWLSYLDTHAITSFTNPSTKESFALYPAPETPIKHLLSQAVMLRIGPHQFQIIGLYVALFTLLTPIAFYLLGKGHYKTLLIGSVVIYLANFGAYKPIRVLGAQFEYAFPLLNWQIIFIVGLVAGYYKTELYRYFTETNKGRFLTVGIVTLCVLFWLYTMNNPIDQFPAWARLEWIEKATFYQYYNAWFQKNNLGPGRLLNAICLVFTLYVMLTLFWKPLNKAFGWLLIPLGQASLYVFFVHIFFIILVHNSGLAELQSFWLNTAMHTALLLITLLMVKTEFLYKWIPR